MRICNIIGFIVLLATSCEPPMPPTDEEMIRLFHTHETAFRKVHDIIAEHSEGGFHYPPLCPYEDIMPDSTEAQGEPSDEPEYGQDTTMFGLTKKERRQLDSLLTAIGCGFMRVDREEREVKDSASVSLVLVYYSHGIVDAGTSKCFVYDPGLKSRQYICITEHGDLNEIYRRTYNDTTLYKPIKGDWYIELDHSR